MKNRILSATAIAAIVFASATAQAAISKDTREFIEQASIGGMFEIKSSELAVQKSKDADVVGFAKEMIEDHKAADGKLTAAIEAAKIPAADKPANLDKKHQKLLDKLGKKDGKSFDETYTDDQKSAHKDTVKLFEKYADKGDNAQLKAFAAETLPTLKEHEAQADKLEDKKD